MDDQLVSSKLGQRQALSRIELLALHPIMNHEPVETAAIVSGYRLIKVLVVVGHDGCCIEGARYAGKSTLLSSISELFQADFPQIPIFEYSVRLSTMRWDEFLVSWLKAVGHEFQKGPRHILRERISRRLVDAAMSRDSRKIMLLIDNACSMDPQCLYLLADLRSDLAKYKVNLITVFVGDIGTADHLRTLAKGNGALMPSLNLQVSMPNLSREDIKLTLETIDKLPFFEAGTTWSQFFMQEAWENKWRLADHVTTFYQGLELSGLGDALRQAYRKNKKENPEVPSGLLFMTLRPLLFRLGTLGANFKTEEMAKYWDIAIRTSGYVSTDLKLNEALHNFGLPGSGQRPRG